MQPDDAHERRCAYYPECEGHEENAIPWQELLRWNPNADLPHEPEWGVRYYVRIHKDGWIIVLRSQQVREGRNNPAGWVPMVWLERHEGGSVTTQSLSLDRIVATEYEANRMILQAATRWIGENG